MSMYCGIGGVQKEIKNLYTGIGGVRKDITEMWVGNAGVKKQIFSSARLLGDMPVGSEVTLTESGSPELYIVVNQGLPSSNYDSSCDGTWLLRKFIDQQQRPWDTSEFVFGYNKSTMDKYLQTTFAERFSTYAIKNLFMLPQIPVHYYNGQSNYEARVFLLSMSELDESDNTSIPQEGSALQYFIDSGNSKKIAYLDGTAKPWWSRSMYKNASNLAWGINASGDMGNFVYTKKGGVRPAIILKKDTIVSGDGSIVEG